MATSTPLDVTASATSTGTSFSSGATATLAQATNLAVGTCANNDYESVAYVPGGSFVNREPPSGTGHRIYIASFNTSSTSAVTFTATVTNSTIWSCGVAIFKAAGGGAAASPRGTLIGVLP